MNHLNLINVRQYLQDFDFYSLFIELGWNNPTNSYSQYLSFFHDYESIDLQYQEISNFKGVFVIKIEMETIPNKSLRQKIAQALKPMFAEHILILVDQNQSECLWVTHSYQNNKTIWQEHRYLKSQPDRSFIAKLAQMAISFKDLENNIGLIDTLNRMDKALDVDKVTKKFYDLFKKEHDAFLKFIDGIPNEDDKQWYASVVINRIMFIYFLQKKVFLNQDVDYLNSKLTEFQNQDYYNDFLVKLFFDGFAKKEINRSEEIKNLIGKIPYLNGGLFIPHQIEIENKNISIQNQGFERLFKFLNQFDWVLDDREIAKENEINPDILGYIYEKYINQKQMGAYYTKEDITDYISKNCIIPNLFDQLNLDASIFDFMQDDPDRYIHDSIKHGTLLELPNEINDLNKIASEDFALPTEIWREVIARRNRYSELKNLIINQKIYNINDLITYNLDIKLFAHDLIQKLDQNQLQHLWTILNHQKILDPTCGSGAFLFAGLNILYPLYEQVAKRLNLNITRYALIKSIIINNLYGVDIMDEAVEIAKLRLFLKLVSQVDQVEDLEPLPDIDFNIRAGNTLIGYANFDEIGRSIDNNNQGSFNFDTDILAKIKQKTQKIGNLFTQFQQQQTLDIKRQLQKNLNDLELELNRYLAKDYSVDSENNDKLLIWLENNKPFHWIVEFFPIISTGGFDVIIGNPPYVEYSKVKATYEIKNYKTESCGNLYAFVMERSLKLLKSIKEIPFENKGLHNIGHSNIGNYNVGYFNQGDFNKGHHNIGDYNTGNYNQGNNNLGDFNIGDFNIGHNEERKNLFATGIQKANGRCGMIVPISLPSTPRMQNVRKLFNNKSLWLSHFADRPGCLFNGVHQKLTIFLSVLAENLEIYSTAYSHWYSSSKFLNSSERTHLLNKLVYINDNLSTNELWYKLPSQFVLNILSKINIKSNYFEKNSKFPVYLNMRMMYWAKAFLPQENKTLSNEYKAFYCKNEDDQKIVLAIFNSGLYFLFWEIISDCWHITAKEIDNFNFNLSSMSSNVKNNLVKLADELLIDLEKNKKYVGTVQTDYEYYHKQSKQIIDQIDRILAQHYGFTDEELDYIINYDIKYRMGKDDSDE